MTTATLHHGDCLAVMGRMEANSVDAIVTDPPYGLGFMGKHWDHGVPGEDFWREALRVAKPGAHLLAFGGTRTFHRLMVAIEDAGWEIRDTLGFLYGPLLWGYGSGFPKSANGPWGSSALKPAYEPIIMARKPIERTLANNFEKWGCGGINVEGCRIGTEEVVITRPDSWRGFHKQQSGVIGESETVLSTGRWPANIIHDGSEQVLGVFPRNVDGQIGGNNDPNGSMGYHGGAGGKSLPGIPDSGSAARFFYCAKASREDRNEGLEWSEEKNSPKAGGGMLDENGRDKWRSTLAANHHPTVKPTALMRYLCRLVTPAEGVVLDPFMGSGSTGKAAIAEGFAFVGIEMEAEYVEIARRRINHALGMFGECEVVA